MRRGNRHLVGVVMGGRSGGSRDAIMRSLLAENLEKAATTRTVAAITERNPADANADVAEDEAAVAPDPGGSGAGRGPGRRGFLRARRAAADPFDQAVRSTRSGGRGRAAAASRSPSLRRLPMA